LLLHLLLSHLGMRSSLLFCLLNFAKACCYCCTHRFPFHRTAKTLTFAFACCRFRCYYQCSRVQGCRTCSCLAQYYWCTRYCHAQRSRLLHPLPVAALLRQIRPRMHTRSGSQMGAKDSRFMPEQLTVCNKCMR